jgi:hypothetical protein
VPSDREVPLLAYYPALPVRVLRTEIIAGPTITAIIAGKTKMTSGNRILIDAFCADSSARRRRRVRNASELERSAGAI